MYEGSTQNDEESITLRLWSIRFSLPKDESKGRKWQVNKSLTVAADTMEDAITKARRRDPDAKFWQVNHGGLLDVSE